MTSTWRRTLSYLGLAPDEEYEDYDRYDDPTMAPAMTQQVSAVNQTGPTTGTNSVITGSHSSAGSHGSAGLHGSAGATGSAAVTGDQESSTRVSSVRPISVVDDDDGDIDGPGPDRSVGDRSATGRTGNVRSINPTAAQVKPVVLSPAAFGDAKTVGDHFKNERPVIMNLQGADRDLRRRLIDFASGICYGLGGQMTRVAKEIFLLTPADVEVSEEDQKRLAEHGLYEV